MKNQLRKKFKALRDALIPLEVEKNSQAVIATLTSYPFWQKAKRIMCYLSIGNEIQTVPLIEKAWEAKKEVIIPVCQKETLKIKPSLLNSFADLEPKTMGILEPKEGKMFEVDPSSIDLCLIPGLAFDLQGHRIGFGAGYYDRFLPLLNPTTPKMALAHEIQISSETLPVDPHDVLMDYICTEKKIYKITRQL